MFNYKHSTGQTITEYAIVVALVIGAIVAMELYVKRTLQSRYRGAVKYLTAQMGADSQYEPYYTNSEFEVTRNYQSQSNLFGKLDIDRSVYEKVNRTGTQILLPCEATEEGCGSGTGTGCTPAGGACSGSGDTSCCSPASCVATKLGWSCCVGLCS